MTKEAKNEFIKKEVEKHNSEISESTKKGVGDAIKGDYDPPKSTRGENALTGAFIGIIGGPLGIIIGAGAGAASENKERKEYDDAHEKTLKELEKTK